MEVPALALCTASQHSTYRCHPAVTTTLLAAPAGCGKGFKKGQARFGCNVCDFDICASCLPAAQARAHTLKRPVGETEVSTPLPGGGAALSKVQKTIGTECLDRLVKVAGRAEAVEALSEAMP
jgi:hypothetical protein